MYCSEPYSLHGQYPALHEVVFAAPGRWPPPSFMDRHDPKRDAQMDAAASVITIADDRHPQRIIITSRLSLSWRDCCSLPLRHRRRQDRR